MGLDGFGAEAQLGGDLLGRFAVGDEAGGFFFAVGEGGEFAVGPGDASHTAVMPWEQNR